MNKLQQLTEARIAALARAEAASATAPTGVLSTEAQSTFDAAMSDVERLDGEIVAEQAAQDAAASAAQTTAARTARLAAARGAAAPRTVQRTDSPNAHRIENVRARGDADPTRGFASVGHFARSVFLASTGQGFDPMLAPLAAAQGMNQGVGSEGGWLIPPQFSLSIWDGLNDPAESLLAMCDRYPIDGESMTFPANAETSRANGSRYGGINSYWLAEGAQATKSAPKIRRAKIEPHKLVALVYATEELLAGASTLSTYLQRAATDEINFRVGDSIFNGTGTGLPLGIMNSGALVTVNKETSQAAGTLLQKNISKMWARLHPRCRKNAVWFINVDVDPELDGFNVPIKNVAGTENVGGIGNNVYNAEKYTLKGRPIMPIEYCQSLGTLGDIVLADMSMYLAGDRNGIQAAQSMHLRFDYGETAFRFMFAVDGQPWLAAPLTPKNGSNTLSSFVTLQAR